MACAGSPSPHPRRFKRGTRLSSQEWGAPSGPHSPALGQISGPAPRKSQDLVGPSCLLSRADLRVRDPHSPMAPSAWKGLCLAQCSAVAILKLLIILNEGTHTVIMHWALQICSQPRPCQGRQSGHSSHLLESRSSRKESVLPPTVGCKPCSHRPAFEQVLSNFRCTGRGYFRHQDRFLAAKSKPQRSWCPALLHLQSSETRPQGWGWCLSRSPSAKENHTLEKQRRLTFCLDCAKCCARLPAPSPGPSTGNYSDEQKQQPFQQKVSETASVSDFCQDLQVDKD